VLSGCEDRRPAGSTESGALAQTLPARRGLVESTLDPGQRRRHPLYEACARGYYCEPRSPIVDPRGPLPTARRYFGGACDTAWYFRIKGISQCKDTGLRRVNHRFLRMTRSAAGAVRIAWKKSEISEQSNNDFRLG